MVEHPFLAELLGFCSFVSSTYGTGDVLVDSGAVLGAILLSLIAVQTLSLVGLAQNTDRRELELLVSASELLSEMSVQISELRTTVVSEMEKHRGEMGYIKQELESLFRVQSYLERDGSVGRRPEDLRIDTIFQRMNDKYGRPPQP